MILNDNFYAWFKASMMHDEMGTPSIFYHRSRSQESFTEFKHDGVQKNEYNDCYGFYFVHQNSRFSIQHIAPNGAELYCLLRIEKPFYIYPKPFYAEDMLGNKHQPLHIDKAFADKIIGLGYDSIIIDNGSIQGAHMEFVVFEPNQIKSVENSGAYGLSANNIFE